MEHNITETVKHLAAIHQATGDIFWKSTRKGSTGQGHTYETNVVVKAEDNLAEADYVGTEIKTSSAKGGRVRKFTMNFGAEQLLTESFGAKNSEGKQCLNRSLRVGKPSRWNGQVVDLALDDDALRLTAGDVTTFIPRERIIEVLDKKIANMMIVSVDKRKSGDDWAYRYPAFTYLAALDHNRFFDALANGTIAVEFRVRGDKDYGTSFNINKKKLAELYCLRFDWSREKGIVGH